MPTLPTNLPQTSAPPESGGMPEGSWRASDNALFDPMNTHPTGDLASTVANPATMQESQTFFGSFPEYSPQHFDEWLRNFQAFMGPTMPSLESSSATNPPAEPESRIHSNAQTAAGDNLQQPSHESSSATSPPAEPDNKTSKKSKKDKKKKKRKVKAGTHSNAQTAASVNLQQPTHESSSATNPPAESEPGTRSNAQTAAGGNLQQSTHESSSATSPPAEPESGTRSNAQTAAGDNLQQAQQKTALQTYLDYASGAANTFTAVQLFLTGFNFIKRWLYSEKSYQEQMIAAVTAMNAKVDKIADLFLKHTKHTESDDGVLKNIKELLRKLPSEILKESQDRDKNLLQVLDKAVESLEALKTQHDDQKSRDERKIQLLGDLKNGQDVLKDDLKKCLDDIKKSQDELKKGQADQHRENTSQYERMIQALEINYKLLEALETNNQLLQTLVNLQTSTPAEASKDKEDNSARLYSGPSRPRPRSASEGSQTSPVNRLQARTPGVHRQQNK